MNEIPRRNRIDLYTPAERAIREAMLAVEAAGADTRLTDAVILLGEAHEAVADFVDGVQPKKRRFVRFDMDGPTREELIRALEADGLRVEFLPNDEGVRLLGAVREAPPAGSPEGK